MYYWQLTMAQKTLTASELAAEVAARRGIACTPAELAACANVARLATQAQDAQDAVDALKAKGEAGRTLNGALRLASQASARYQTALTGLGLVGATAARKSVEKLLDHNAQLLTAAPEPPETRGFSAAHPGGLTALGDALWPRPTESDWQILLNGDDSAVAEWLAAREVLG